PDAPALRLHGLVEPVRSHPVVVPRLAGSGTGTLVVVRLARPGTRVRRGDLLIEFDRQAQIKTAHDRQAEYRDFVEQINRKRGEQLTARAHGEAELTIAANAVKSAELEVQKKEVVPPITAEQNQLTLDEARAKINQADVAMLRVGQTARITLDSFPSRTFTGRLEQLSQIGAVSTMSNRVRSFLGIFSIDGTDPHLMPDLAAAIDLAEEQK